MAEEDRCLCVNGEGRLEDDREWRHAKNPWTRGGKFEELQMLPEV